jgi:hypothetical protein
LLNGASEILIDRGSKTLRQSGVKKIPLKSFREKAPNLEVFELSAKASFTPIDFNIFALTQTMDWTISDRMRFWYLWTEDEKLPLQPSVSKIPPHFTIRRLDREEDSLCCCQVSIDGEVMILSNSDSDAQEFFASVFLDVPPSFRAIKDWDVSKQWQRTPRITDWFRAAVDAATGWPERIPPGIDRSIEDAKMNYGLRKWNPCVVMCRRALEEIMRFAFRRFFKQDPENLGFNAIVRKFEKEKPDALPKHWISVLDSVRNLGNVPGAHPPIKRYKFSRVDAQLALLQTTAFREAYFTKIDKG